MWQAWKRCKLEPQDSRVAEQAREEIRRDESHVSIKSMRAREMKRNGSAACLPVSSMDVSHLFESCGVGARADGDFCSVQFMV